MASAAVCVALADLSLRNRPSILSVDSGYGSTASPTQSSFRANWALHDAYEHWRVADDAGQQFAEEERAVEQAITKLREARKAAAQVLPRCVMSLFSVVSSPGVLTRPRLRLQTP